MRKLITGNWYPELENSLIETLRRKKAEAPLISALVVTPNPLLRAHLSGKLAEGLKDYGGIHLYTLKDLAREIAMGNEEDLCRDLPQCLGEAMLQDIFQETEEDFSGDHRGFAAAVRHTISDLKRACVSPRQLAGIGGPKYLKLATIYEKYQEKLKRACLCEPADVLNIAADFAPDSPWLKTFPILLAYGWCRLAPVEREFFRAIWANRDAFIFVPYQEHPAYRPLQDSLEWLISQKFVQTHLLPKKAQGKKIKIISAPDEHKEGELIARSIVEEAGAGKKLDEIGVLVRNPQFYLSSLDNTLRARSVLSFVPARSPGETPEGRLLLTILELILSDFSREVVEKLAASPVLADILPEHRSGFLPSEWNWLGSNLHLVQGGAQWHKALQVFLAQEIFPNHVRQEQLEEAQKRRQEWCAAARALDAFIRFWENAGASLKKAQGKELLGQVALLFAEVCRDTPAREEVAEIAKTLDRAGLPLTLEQAYHILGSALSTPSDAGKNSGGVTLCGLEEGLGTTFAVSFIPGMIEKEFPAITKQDPLLPDEERASINEALRRQNHPGQLELSRSRVAWEKSLFYLAISGCREQYVLTLPRQDALSGKERIASSLALETATALGYPGDPFSFHHCRAVDYVPHNFYFREGWWPLLYDLKLAIEFRDNPEVREALCRHYPFFSRASRNSKARWQKPTLTCYEGVLRSPGILKIIEGHSGGKITAKMLETYAVCPFQYFLRYVLQIPGQAPNNLIPVFPASRRKKILGDILSRILQNEASLLNSLSSEVEDSYRGTSWHIFYPEMVWEIERETMLENLAWCRELLKSPPGLSSMYFKFPYQIAVDIPTGEAPRRITLCGNLDQIRVNSSERQIEGLQYRVGKQEKSPGDGFYGGEVLSPALDMFALCRLFPDYRGRVLYNYLQEGGTLKQTCFSGENWETRQKKLMEICNKIIYGITNGFFFPVPAPDKCRFCPYLEACGPLRHAAFACKSGDPRMDFFYELKTL